MTNSTLELLKTQNKDGNGTGVQDETTEIMIALCIEQ